jgi:NAD(P)-dependent dehydrogenase (short-subunit alcohol dehydrogenase family)
MGRFAGKVVFVTGGASGMGLATVELLAEEGAKVVIADIQYELAKKNAAALGPSVAAFNLDQGSAKSVEAGIRFAEDTFGGLDYAVNAAGIQGPLGPLEELTPEAIQQVLAVNLAGIAYCLKYQAAAMRRRGGGAIVNISSICGIRSTPFLGAYSASKAGVISLTEVAAVENGAHGIRVNTILPGYVDTPLLDARIDRGWAASMTPNKRCGLPKDIADVAAFLLSDDAKQVTGVKLPVDGGLTAGHFINPPGF